MTDQTVIKSDRGFKRLPPIPATHGGQPAGEVRVYESSAASGPHLWLSVTQPADRNHPDNGNTIEATVHLAAEDACRLADQVRYLVEHHYQGDARPAAELDVEARVRAQVAAEIREHAHKAATSGRVLNPSGQGYVAGCDDAARIAEGTPA